jgi:hypothetical protein
MGTLKPGATYIYERNGDEIYAREAGSTERHMIGYNYKPADKAMPKFTHEQIREDKLWGEIRRMAPTNPALQKALDRAIMIYRLSKDKPL